MVIQGLYGVRFNLGVHCWSPIWMYQPEKLYLSREKSYGILSFRDIQDIRDFQDFKLLHQSAEQFLSEIRINLDIPGLFELCFHPGVRS